ncbi:MAG: type II secretion system protein [Gammaproteobacteria bacterium]|nr:type II secretion system protein [Gammaproteobacteria bacterium]
MNGGFTLFECLVVLAIVGIGIALGLPALQLHRDRWAVTQAREASAALLARARVDALGSGVSTVTIQSGGGQIERRLGSTFRERVDLGDRYGVSLDISGRDTLATVEFNALGLGRMAARTLRFGRGAASASLVISAYGRVSRR